jgi:hypothetical protein
MKTPRENKQIKNICHDLMNLLHSAGFREAKVWYDEKPEEIVVEGEIEGRVSVYASSTKAVIIDIFRQLLPAVEQVV